MQQYCRVMTPAFPLGGRYAEFWLIYPLNRIVHIDLSGQFETIFKLLKGSILLHPGYDKQ